MMISKVVTLAGLFSTVRVRPEDMSVGERVAYALYCAQKRKNIKEKIGTSRRILIYGPDAKTQRRRRISRSRTVNCPDAANCEKPTSLQARD